MKEEISPTMLETTYANMPESFYERIRPTPVHHPRLLKFNVELGGDLGLRLGAFSKDELAAFFSGNQLLPGSVPVAQAYAGHQFGGFVPQLGDGRAILLGEVVDRFGVRRDVQLKGSGRTRFSRGGDGRATLGAVIREYVMGEAMFHLGIPTTRGLAIVETGEVVRREVPFPGAILTRVAASHVRVGTFEYFSWRGDSGAVKILADYVLDRHYPESKGSANPYQCLLLEIVRRQARLVAQWTEVGFIHGVMNTDNMAVSGETIDFGPCAFLDEYDPAKVFSSIDRQGRYSFENQPRAALWNLNVLTHCLLPLLHSNATEAETLAREALMCFDSLFQECLTASGRRKLGLAAGRAGDDGFVREFFSLLRDAGADYSLTFRLVSRALEEGPDASALRVALGSSEKFESWLARWRARCQSDGRSLGEIGDGMLATNPAYIARNHLVERAIERAVDGDDWTMFDRVLEAVSRPFEERDHLRDLMAPPKLAERVTQTYCGT